MAKCIDCVYSEPYGNNMDYRCTKTGKKFDYEISDPTACSKFRESNDGYNSCYQCDHYSKTFFGSYMCELKNKKVNGDDRACSSFRDY